MSEPITLTPAQVRFLSRHIESYSPDRWVSEVAGRAGSDRQFVRVRETHGGRSLVMIVWDSADGDWKRFLSIQSDLAPKAPFLPMIYAHDDSMGLILEEDFGSMTLARWCSGCSSRDALRERYLPVIDSLVTWQSIDPQSCATIRSRSMDIEMFLWESDYFAQHCVTEYFGLKSLLDATWEEERTTIAKEAAALPPVCIHRDFQSENILLRDGNEVGYVDFQGARLGPAGYDLASLLYDPYVPDLDDGLVAGLVGYYRSCSPSPLSDRAFRLCALQRVMQALGAYGNLSLHKGKPTYRRYIPLAMERLNSIVDACEGGFPRLGRIVDACCEAIDTRLNGQGYPS